MGCSHSPHIQLWNLLLLLHTAKRQLFVPKGMAAFIKILTSLAYSR